MESIDFAEFKLNFELLELDFFVITINHELLKINEIL